MTDIPTFLMPSPFSNGASCVPYTVNNQNCHARSMPNGAAINASMYEMSNEPINNTTVFGPDGVREYDPMANLHYFMGNMQRFKAMGPQRPIIGQRTGVTFGTPLGAVNYAKTRSSDACDSDYPMFQDKSNPKDVTPVLNGLTTVPTGVIPYKVDVPSFMGQHDPRLTEAQCPNGSPTNYFRGSLAAFKPRFTPIETKFLQAQQTREKHMKQYAHLKQQGTVSGIF